MGRLDPREIVIHQNGVISTHIFHPRGEHNGGSLEIHIENPYFGPSQDPRNKIRPPNSYQEHILNTRQLEGGGQICGRR